VLTTAFQNGCEKKVAQMHFVSEPTLAFPNSGRDEMTVTGNTLCRTASMRRLHSAGAVVIVIRCSQKRVRAGRACTVPVGFSLRE